MDKRGEQSKTREIRKTQCINLAIKRAKKKNKKQKKSKNVYAKVYLCAHVRDIIT